ARDVDNLSPPRDGGVTGFTDCGDADAAGEGRVIGHETAHDVAGRAVKDLHVRTTARAGAGDDVGDVVFEIDRCRRDEHAAAECRIVRHELTNHGAGESVEHADVRSPARAGRGDDVVDSVAGGVGHGHTYAAAERRVVGQEAPHQVTVDVVNVDH